MRCLSASDLARLLKDWRFWANKEQLAPEGFWRAWLFLGGRGAGKTRAGAEWVQERVQFGGARRIALVAPTFHDVREVMIDGPSGLRALDEERPSYEPSRRRLVWSNGAEALCFSAEDPQSLRGPQFDTAWCDELCFWRYPEETLATLAEGLRLGERPLMLATTTPRPIPALKQLMAAKDTALTRGSTWANAPNLSAGYVAALNERFRGSARERQELLGELIEDLEGALWSRRQLEKLRVRAPAPFERIVVAVDPPAGMGPGADMCGIIGAGASGEGAARRAIVLADASVQGLAPLRWAERAAELARTLGADSIVAEANNGGELVRTMLKLAAPEMRVKLVHASVGKRARAEPIAALYERGWVKHLGALPDLEDQMCAFGAEGFSGSPDRLDALVWALTELMLGGASPRCRTI